LRSDFQFDMDEIGPQGVENVSRQCRKKFVFNLIASHEKQPNLTRRGLSRVGS
jgi:hypothetical protein